MANKNEALYLIHFCLDLSPFGSEVRYPMDVILLAQNDEQAQEQFRDFMDKNAKMHQGKRYSKRPKLVKKIILAEG
jgi:hypothetical protein